MIAIVGPTGVGKSQLAIHLATKFSGEIVNADSRQVYRRMDIGTAKPLPFELVSVPHHLFNIVNPDDNFGLAQYQELAYKSIKDIHKRGRIPFLVGGSGQYIWAVLEGWEIPRIPPDLEFRQNLEKMASDKGIDALYQELETIDPATAQKIDKRNIRRVIRALEVCHQSKIPFSQLQRKHPPDYKTKIIGLTVERKELYCKVDARVDEMIKKGLVGELESLTQDGYDYNLPALSGIGYKQIGMAIRGEISLEEAIKQIKTDSHKFIRHQYAWFRLKDARINWFDLRDEAELDISELLANFLN